MYNPKAHENINSAQTKPIDGASLETPTATQTIETTHIQNMVRHHQTTNAANNKQATNNRVPQSRASNSKFEKGIK